MATRDTAAVEPRTERLTLRPVAEADLDALVALHEDPLVVRFFGTMTRQKIAEWVARSGPEWAERGHGRLAIVDRESGAFLGRTGLRYWPEFDEVGMEPLREDTLRDFGVSVIVFALRREEMSTGAAGAESTG